MSESPKKSALASAVELLGGVLKDEDAIRSRIAELDHERNVLFILLRAAMRAREDNPPKPPKKPRKPTDDEFKQS